MARKINPFLFRLNLNRNWNSIWYTNKNNYSNYLIEDISIRKYLNNFFLQRPIGKIMIFKNNNFFFLIIYLKKIFINKSEIYFLKKKLSLFTEKNIFLNFKNILKPDIDVKLIFFYIKRKLEFKKSFKGVIKNIINDVFKSKSLGIKIIIKGRINGNIMTRKQVYFYGKVPSQRFCANIRYYSNYVNTIYGSIGIKIWLYFGDFIY